MYKLKKFCCCLEKKGSGEDEQLIAQNRDDYGSAERRTSDSQSHVIVKIEEVPENLHEEDESGSIPINPTGADHHGSENHEVSSDVDQLGDDHSHLHHQKDDHSDLHHHSGEDHLHVHHDSEDHSHLHHQKDDHSHVHHDSEDRSHLHHQKDDHSHDHHDSRNHSHLHHESEDHSHLHSEGNGDETHLRPIDSPPAEPIVRTDSAFSPISTRTTSPEIVNSEFETENPQNEDHHEEPQTYRIVFLGQSGAGKSTLISGLSNYFSWPEFEKAKTEKMNLSIPVQFTVYSKEDPPVKVNAGEAEDNEHFNEVGQSVTQKPKIHSFKLGDNNVEILDTPGVSDSRGMEQDMINLSLIKEALEQKDEIHAFCIVLKSNESRLGAELELALKNLISLLPREALNNLFFFFTFSSGTFFSFGDISGPLTEFFSNNNINFQLTQDNTCCVDSDSFKYLIAQERGITYSKTRTEKDFQFYWDETAKNIETFFTFLKNIKPITGKEIKHINDLVKESIELFNTFLEKEAYIHEDNKATVVEKLGQIVKSVKEKSLSTKLVDFVHWAQNAGDFAPVPGEEVVHLLDTVKKELDEVSVPVNVEDTSSDND